MAEQPALVVGIPLPAADAEFYEIVSTTELRSTLATLATVLAAFAVLATLAGAALGRIASRRLMAPLDDVATAAARIGAGGLQTRLPPTDDPDLATIVGSFNSMVEALDERIQRDARFAADLGHELRSPLTALVASVQVMERRRDDLPPRTQRALTSSLSSWTGSSRPWRTSSSSVGSTPASAARSSPRSTRPSWSGSRSSRAVTTPR